jgi:hypothetical protein
MELGSIEEKKKERKSYNVLVSEAQRALSLRKEIFTDKKILFETS